MEDDDECASDKSSPRSNPAFEATVAGVYKTDEYVDEESACSSIEPETDHRDHLIPSHQRSSRREKERSRYRGRNSRESPRPSKKDHGLIKEVYRDSILLMLDDRDDSTERRSSNRKRDKVRKASRRYERDVKSGSGDLTEHLITSNQIKPNQIDSVQPLHHVPVETRNRFRCLRSRPSDASKPESHAAMLAARRQISSASLECPQDRIQFYEIFQKLIVLGDKAHKDKEKKDTELFSRQLSSEQEMWQNELRDVLWLELQAWHAGIPNNLSAMDQQLVKNRQKIPEILDRILNFTFIPGLSNDCTQLSQEDGFEDEGAKCPWTELSMKHIQEQREAVIQVTQLLDDLEWTEKLFPSFRHLGREYEQFVNQKFTKRVNALCLWLNISKDLSSLLKLMAKYVGILNFEGVDWSHLDLEHYLPSYEPGEDEEEYDQYQMCQTPQSECSDQPNTTEDMLVGIDTKLLKLKTNKIVRFTGLSGESTPRSPSPTQGVEASTSTPLKYHRNVSSASDLSHSYSDISLDDPIKTSIYRPFVDKSLRKMGLKKIVQRLKNLLNMSLNRARQALEGPECNQHSMNGSVQDDKESTDHSFEITASPSWNLLPEVSESMRQDRRSSCSLEWTYCQVFLSMGLPSFRPTYLFLVRIPLDIIHECLRLRLEQKPLHSDPSILSIRQLIHECKEVLKGAVICKQYYQQMVSAVMWDDESTEERVESDMESFSNDVKMMLEVYFALVQNWMSSLQNQPEASLGLKNVLDEEWTFTKEICPYILGGEAEAGKRFCVMASSLLSSIADFLENEIDECIYDYDTHLVDHDTSLDSTDEAGHSKISQLRQAMMKTCRDLKNKFHEARERAVKALGFTKMLRKDLEIAADFNIIDSTAHLLFTLKETKHIKIITPHSSGYAMFIPQCIIEDKYQILILLNVTCGREDVTHADCMGEEEGYLLLVKCSPDTCQKWDGPVIRVDPTAETTIALSHIDVEGLLLIVIHSSQLSKQRKVFEKKVGKVVELVNEQTSCHQAIAESLDELKTTALSLREKISSAIEKVDEKLNTEDIAQMEETEKTNLEKLYRETMHQCYNFGFEYHKEVTRLVSGDTRQKLGQGLLSFAKQWMQFVTKKCERGRGLRPRWANHGLEFLIVACEPRNLANLSSSEFEELKESINGCISHVIGSKDKPVSDRRHLSNRVNSPDVTAQRYIYKNQMSCPEPVRPNRSMSTRSTQSDPPSTPNSADVFGGCRELRSKSVDQSNLHEVKIVDGEDGGLVMEVDGAEPQEPLTPFQKLQAAIHLLETERNDKLFRNHVIGRVTGKKSEIEYHISGRRVNFKWQRGQKIGEGQFGKVYAAVNMDTGDIMAMKEIKFAPNDHQTIKDIADEIKNFEGIQHESLVKYYGVEVHRDEMLIFMEYCDEGTIEEAAKVGLTEAFVRKYTKEILVAVNVLHDHSIVHRDIKGANIFLTSNGPVKLGDFGCSVKLKNHTTMPGEVNNLVGTTAFMAPEVITKNATEGHGRAADIWSLGCVVVEMATGKRPWHELENNYQIMFKVGMGATPSIPDNLSEEGKDFLSLCFEQDPKQRALASQLMDHAFIKVYLEEYDIV